MMISDRVRMELRNALPMKERANVDVHGTKVVIRGDATQWPVVWGHVCDLKGNTIEQIISKCRGALIAAHLDAIEKLKPGATE